MENKAFSVFGFFVAFSRWQKWHFEVAFSAPELTETIRRSKQLIWKYVLHYVHFHSNQIHFAEKKFFNMKH